MSGVTEQEWTTEQMRDYYAADPTLDGLSFPLGHEIQFEAEGPTEIPVVVTGVVIGEKRLDGNHWLLVDTDEPVTFYGVKPCTFLSPESATAVLS